MTRSRRSFVALAALFALAGLGQAQQTSAVLNNGPGDCSMNVTVDGYGGWGVVAAPGGQLNFDRAGALGIVGTTYQSALLVTSSCNANVWLTQATGFPTGALPAPPTFTGSGLSCTSGGPIPGGLTFRLVQTLNSPVDLDCGSTLLQRYEITNTNSQACDLCIMRAVDFDMNGSPADRTASSVTVVGGNLGNDHWISQWDDPDTGTGPVVSITAEGITASGSKAASAGFRSGQFPFLATLNTGGCAALTRAIHLDANLDLINAAPEGSADCVSAIGARYPQVPAGGTIVFVTRTRISTRPGVFHHDVVPLVEAGNVGYPTLHVNASAGPCVVAGGPITVSMASPPSGAPGHYIVYVHVGKPLLGGIAGGATAPDWCIWNIPGFGNIGDGSINVGAFPISGRGGQSTPGFAIFSSVPGLALLTTPLATGAPPGAPIFGPIGLPAGLSLTLQGALVDIGGGLSIKVTNAVEIVTAPALCQP